MQTRLIGGASYFTRAQLEANNPSRREGIDAVAEARWRSTTSKLVKAAVKTLKLPDWVYETSMNYINRFFLTRSISKNDRHLVVGGAILLASKVQESPRSVQDVAYVLIQLKNANKQKSQLGPDQTTLEQFMEGVVLAEQAMLFSLNFNLNVETHVSLARRLLEPLNLWAKANPPPEEAEVNQLKLSLYGAVMFFLNDSALTNLSLQYPNYKVAPVCLVMAAKRIAAARYSGKEAPAELQRVLALGNDAEWFESKGLTLDQAADIEAQIYELYATSPAQPAAQQQRQQQSQAAQLPQSQQPDHMAAAADPLSQEPAMPEPLSQQQPQQAVTQADGAAGEPRHMGEAGPSVATGVYGAARTEHAFSLLDNATRPSCEPSRPESSPLPAALCKQGQPSSSAAAAAGDRAMAEGTPEMPHAPSPCDEGTLHGAEQQQPIQRPCKRVSDGDDCAAGEQQATSELHVVPERQPEGVAEAPPTVHDVAGASGGGACMAYNNGIEDSANENCSPNGLTAGNASGSGCGHPEGQPEVCSRLDGSCQQLTSKLQAETQCAADGAGGGCGATSHPVQLCGGKRGRLEGDGGVSGEVCMSGSSVLAPVIKARRLDEGQSVALQHVL